MDQNVAQDIVPVVASKQVVARGTWTAEHRILLLRQCCIDSCNPITKQGNIATSCAWNCLQFALSADPNRMFAGFLLSIDSLHRQSPPCDVQAKSAQPTCKKSYRSGWDECAHGRSRTGPTPT
eukprot:scaffold840_cov344-Pavlova_lutheri.AAC.141